MHIRRVSLDETGQQFDGQSFLNHISADGGHVFFDPQQFTTGSPGDIATLAYDFNTAIGSSNPITLRLAAEQSTTGGDYLVSSTDGSVIAFNQIAEGLVPGDTNETSDVFVLDRDIGAVVRASQSATGAQADDESFAPLLTADGGKVIFASAATNLVSGDSNGVSDIFIRDLGTGTVSALTLDRSSETAGLDLSLTAMSADGGKLLVVGDDGAEGTFLIDRDAGTTTRLSSLGSRFSTFGDLTDLSADGSLALVPGDVGGVELIDVATGTRTPLAGDQFVQSASLSADGRFAAFVTRADGVVADDHDGRSDIFVHDHLLDRTWRVSVNDDGDPIDAPLPDGFSQRFGSVLVEQAPGESFPLVAFNSDLALTSDDTNGTTDVYTIEVDAIGVADHATTAPGVPVRIDVLANDIDLDGAPMRVTSVEPVADATVTIEGDAIVFAPGPGFGESAAFAYTLDDGEGNVAQALVRVQVAEPGTLVVTTSEDVVADDGLLSLREAVLAANDRAGADRIEFDDALRGASLTLVQGPLSVTDDLTIDGDAGDGGPLGVVISADAGERQDFTSAIRVAAVQLEIEDLTLAAVSGTRTVEDGIYGSGSDITLRRAAVTGFGDYDGRGVDLRDGILLVDSSAVSDIGGYGSAFGILASDSAVQVVDFDHFRHRVRVQRRYPGNWRQQQPRGAADDDPGCRRRLR